MIMLAFQMPPNYLKLGAIFYPTGSCIQTPVLLGGKRGKTSLI